VGAVRGIDPETGHYYDDTRRYIDAIGWLKPADREKIYSGNVGRVYPRFRPPRAPVSPTHRR
jgi:4-oxalmesaconate hydratase